MELNEILTLEIIDINHMGRGVAKSGELVVFVIGAVTGDKVKAKIIEIKKKFVVAEVVEIIEASKYREEAKCKYFGRCGGCTIMNLSYDKQVEIKNNLVLNSFKKAKINLENVEILDAISMEDPYRFRNKTTFAVRTVNGKAMIGTYEYKSHKLVDIDACLLQDERIDELLVKMKKIIEANNITSYDRRSKKGTIRHIIFRKNYLDQIMIVIVTAKEDFADKNKFMMDVCSMSDDVVTVVQNVNARDTSEVLGRKNTTISGMGTLEDKILGKKIIVSPHTFLQVNHVQTEKLYEAVHKLADVKKEDVVLDLYCGIGALSLLEADTAERVIGIEVVEQAIKDAKNNAKINGLVNTRFVCGRVEEKLPVLIKKGIKADVVIVDPPRLGCKAAIESIISLNAAKLVYVSCNPSTLARDAVALIEAGYEMKKIQVVDMFCQSSSIETIATFEKK